MKYGRPRAEAIRLDEAARAGWLYYVAGNTQDEIARKLGVSRQSAQRLVSLAVSEGLVKVRLDHPIARCMSLAEALRAAYPLRLCEVVPSDPEAPDLLAGVAIAAAAEIERVLKSPEPRIVALGTGRALKATVEQMPMMHCPQHQIVSLLGNIMTDGSATPYDAVTRMADRVNAPYYPYPLPVVAHDGSELAALQRQEPARNTLALCAAADLTMVGIGQMDDTAPLMIDGVLSAQDLHDLRAAGAVGEITGWVYDREGELVKGPFTSRVASAPLPRGVDRPVVAVVAVKAKLPAIRAALRGQLVNGLVTTEALAEQLIDMAD